MYTREQFFHAWRTFYFDGNAKTIDAYVQMIKQVAAIHNYAEPQIWKRLKTVPSHLYWVLFPKENLRQAVETTKMILTAEKFDRQLAGWSTGAPSF